MKYPKLLFLLVITLVMGFGLSQVTTAAMLIQNCDAACEPHNCTTVECRCPVGTPNAGDPTDCIGYINQQECGNLPVACWW